MRIGINLLASKNEKSGLMTYCKNLLENLGKVDKENQFFLFSNKSFSPELIFDYKNFYYIKLPINPYHKIKRALFEQILFPFYIKRYKIDILFNPTAFHPLFPGIKSIVCVHSGGPLYYKFNSLSQFYLKFIYWAAIKFSPRIITISNFSKREILEKCKVDPEKIKVIHLGISRVHLPPELEQKTILERFKIKTPYFFFIGSICHTKNIKNLIEAFKIINSKYPDFYLVLFGKVSPEFSNIKEIIKNLGIEKKIIITNSLREEEKNVLFANSIALVFPSFHEGFGLPVLEAQSLGVPVLTSNTSALPEVAGKGALFVDPYQIEDIARGMEKIAFNESLRKDLIEKGFENVKQYSWEITAKETLKVLKETFYENSSGK